MRIFIFIKHLSFHFCITNKTEQKGIYFLIKKLITIKLEFQKIPLKFEKKIETRLYSMNI